MLGVWQTTERRGLPARLEKKNNGGSRGSRKGSLFPSGSMVLFYAGKAELSGTLLHYLQCFAV